jgi:hypothetical protein
MHRCLFQPWTPFGVSPGPDAGSAFDANFRNPTVNVYVFPQQLDGSGIFDFHFDDFFVRASLFLKVSGTGMGVRRS